MSLYKTTSDILKLEYILYRLEEEGEDYEGASDDIEQFLIAPKEEQLAEKIDAYVHVVRGIEASVKARKKEITHLKNMNKAELNTIKRLKENAKLTSQQLDRPKLKGNAHTITVSTTKKPAAIDIIGDLDDIPSRFTYWYEELRVDKKAILEHLQDTGEIVSGVEARKVTKVMMR